MPDRVHIGLDNPAFSGRLRQRQALTRPSRVGSLPRPSARYYSGAMSQRRQHLPTHNVDQSSGTHPTTSKRVPTSVAAHKPQRSQVLARPTTAPNDMTPVMQKSQPRYRRSLFSFLRRNGYTRSQYALVSMAVMIFVVGVVVSVVTLQTNRLASDKVAALSKNAAGSPASGDTPGAASPGTPPSSDKPSDYAISSYTVGPTLPRYLNIPKFGVHARVLSLGILNSGALATPNNVFDTGWYNESSLPGQPGAMLVDGHVSSWSSNGVFYNIKDLTGGDQIQIVRGDGKIFSYSVIKVQKFDHNDVDMQSAVTPIYADKPGLNLITCTGDVIKGTNEFSQRVIVYTEQI